METASIPPTKPHPCPKYEGWSCFILACFAFIIGIILIAGVGGPWYHDCGTNDCSMQYYYGVYCEDYCWYGNYGPGNNVLALCLLLACCFIFIPLCWHSENKGRKDRRLFNEL